MEDSDKLITAAAVRDLCGGVSDMSLWRWLHDPALDFPKPIIISRRRYWRASKLSAWIESRAEHQPSSAASSGTTSSGSF